MSSRLARSRLIAYAVLALPLAALNLPLNVYVPTFYAREFGLDLAAIGVLLLVARIIDIFTDPLIGGLQDRTFSRFGRRKPWIAGGLPILLLASFMLFAPQHGGSGEVGVTYLFFWLSLAYLAWTVMQLGYGAWGAELSSDYHERTRITGWRESFVILGIVTAAALPAVLGLDPGDAGALWAIFLLMALATPIAAWCLLVYVPDPPRRDHGKIGLRAGLAIAAENRPFRQLIVAYLVNGIANGLPATLFLLFVEHRLGAGEAAGPLLLLYFLSGILAVPLWLWLSRYWGKHRTWSVAMLWAVGIFACVPLLPQDGGYFWFALICLGSGAGLGADLALPASMQADVIDWDEARTGTRRTGLFFAAWSMATKLALALAAGIAFISLDLAGFDASSINEGTAMAALVGLYALLPVLFKLLAIWLVWGFALDEQAQAQLRTSIESSKP